MKQKLKICLKIKAILIYIFFVNFSCVKDDFAQPEQEQVREKQIQKITLDQLNNRIGNSKDFQNLSKAFDINRPETNQFNRLEQDDNPWLLTDEIVMIQKEGATYYTFKIATETDSVKFYNLIVVFDDIGNILSTKILEYTPSENWLVNTSQPFFGQVSSHENNIFSPDDINNIFSSRAARQCITGVNYIWNCGANNDHPPGHAGCTPANNAVTEIIGISIQYGACPPELTQEEDVNYPVNTSSSTGGGSGPGGSNNNIDNDCIPSIDNPCDEDETTPMFVYLGSTRQCNKIKKVIQNYDPEFMTKVLDLKNKDGLTFESSVAIFDDNSVAEYQGVVNASTVKTLPTTPPSEYVSMAHVHNETDVIKTYSVPSLGDLEWIARRYKDGYLNSSKFVAFLATADGTYFAFTINNANKFWGFFKYLDAGNMSITQQERIDAAVYLGQIYEPILEKYYGGANPLIKENAQGASNNEQQLKYFMQFLDEADAGITLFETDENFSTFTELSLNGSNVHRDEEPCQF